MSGRVLLLAALSLVACTKAESKAEKSPNPSTDPAPAAVEAPKAAAPAPVTGGEGGVPANANDTSYKLTLEPPAPVAAGSEAVARIRVTPGTGYKMNKEFPTKLTLTPPAGVTLAKAEFVLSDAEAFDDKQLVFAVKATPASAGEFTVSGKLKFAVCTDATCDPKRENVSIKVAAK